MGGMSTSPVLLSNLIVPLLFGVALCNGLLSAVVFRSNPKQTANRTFALVAMSVAFWAATNALFRTIDDVGLATLWAQLAYVSALSTAAAFLHFSWVYPRRNAAHLAAPLVMWLLAILVSALTFVPGFIIRSLDLDGRRILTAPGVYLVALYLVGAVGWSFVRFFRSQARLKGRARAQARYVLYGATLMALFGLVFNLFLPLLGNYQWVWLGPLCSLFFVGFSAYSIVANHLFDIRILIRRTLVYSLLLAALAGAFAALEQGLEHLLRPLLGTDGGVSPDLLAALVVGFAVDPLKRALHDLVTHRFFREEPREERDEVGHGWRTAP